MRYPHYHESNRTIHGALALALFVGGAGVAACGPRAVKTYGPKTADDKGNMQFEKLVEQAKLGSPLSKAGLYGSQLQGLEVRPRRAKIAEPVLLGCMNGFSKSKPTVVAPLEVVAEGEAVVTSIGQESSTMQSVHNQPAVVLIVHNGQAANQPNDLKIYDIFVCQTDARPLATGYAQLPGFQSQAQIPSGG